MLRSRREADACSASLPVIGTLFSELASHLGGRRTAMIDALCGIAPFSRGLVLGLFLAGLPAARCTARRCAAASCSAKWPTASPACRRARLSECRRLQARRAAALPSRPADDLRRPRRAGGAGGSVLADFRGWASCRRRCCCWPQRCSLAMASCAAWCPPRRASCRGWTQCHPPGTRLVARGARRFDSGYPLGIGARVPALRLRSCRAGHDRRRRQPTSWCTSPCWLIRAWAPCRALVAVGIAGQGGRTPAGNAGVAAAAPAVTAAQGPRLRGNRRSPRHCEGGPRNPGQR